MRGNCLGNAARILIGGSEVAALGQGVGMVGAQDLLLVGSKGWLVEMDCALSPRSLRNQTAHRRSTDRALADPPSPGHQAEESSKAMTCSTQIPGADPARQ